VGRVGGAEPGLGPARELAAGCTGADLVLSGALSVGGALSVAGALEVIGAFKHGANKLWLPATVGDTSDGSATLSAAQLWTLPSLSLVVGKRVTQVSWLFNGAAGGTKTMALRKTVVATSVASTVHSVTSALSGLRLIAQDVSPDETFDSAPASEAIYSLRFAAGNNGDVLYGAGVEFDRP
jgi:hypothetical protein